MFLRRGFRALFAVWMWGTAALSAAAAEPATPATVADEFPPELVRQVPAEGNPVFTARPGAWDARIRERGWILREGDRWRMWYTGYDGTKTGLRMLGLAESADGLAWKRVGDGPLVRDHWIEDMMVLKHDDAYHLVCEGANDVAQAYESADGVRWRHVGPLDIRLKNGEPIPPGPRGTPTLRVENDLWYLFYERGDKGVWLATSRDRKVWTNLQDEPVIAKGPGEYDAHAVALNQVFRVDGKYYASYHASAFPDWKVWNSCLAVSDDLIHWRKYPNNPVLQDNKSSGQYVHDGTRWRLYTHHDQVRVHFPADDAPR